MTECKVIHRTEAMMINHLETPKVEVQLEEYTGKMMIRLREVSIEMVNILGVVVR